ncbi:hypothetical protein LSAT2_027884 [Lamellibrachia satsuma]|nr:hypothetical protein LSAT2_027884 [Lamellibrachia satsuma]
MTCTRARQDDTFRCTATWRRTAVVGWWCSVARTVVSISSATGSATRKDLATYQANSGLATTTSMTSRRANAMN